MQTRSLSKNILYPIICLISVFVFHNNAKSENITFPTDSCNVSYKMYIEFGKGYLSGICILGKENNIIKSSIINEFGVSIMDFTYDMKKDKVKLMYVMNTLNKWYIKRVLKKDLKEVVHLMQNGENEYRNNKRKLYYQFVLMTTPDNLDTIE